MSIVMNVDNTEYTVNLDNCELYEDDIFCIEVPHRGSIRVWSDTIPRIIRSARTQDTMGKIEEIEEEYPEQSELETCLEALTYDLNSAHVLSSLTEALEYIANPNNKKILVAALTQYLEAEEFIERIK